MLIGDDIDEKRLTLMYVEPSADGNVTVSDKVALFLETDNLGYLDERTRNL